MATPSGTALDVTADATIGGTLTADKLLYSNVYMDEASFLMHQPIMVCLLMSMEQEKVTSVIQVLGINS